MTPKDVETLFTRADGSFVFARWGRAIAPVVFGVDDATLVILRHTLDTVIGICGHDTAETDVELGANLMVFFIRDWRELTDTPNLDRLIPDLASLVARLEAEGANQYRIFRFDKTGAIKACFVFIRLDTALSGMPAETLALSQIAQSVLLWSDTAFAETSPLAAFPDGRVAVRPEIADLMAAAYDPVLPAAARDPSHALRLFARLPQS